LFVSEFAIASEVEEVLNTSFVQNPYLKCS